MKEWYVCMYMYSMCECMYMYSRPMSVIVCVCLCAAQWNSLLPYLIAGTKVQGVVEHRATFPVLDLHEARAFGRTAILQVLVGRYPPLAKWLGKKGKKER